MLYGTLKNLQRSLAIVGPGITTFFGWYHAWRVDFAKNVVGAALVLVVGSVYVAIALYKRSRGEEAVIGTCRIVADTDESPDDPVDYAGSLDFLLVVISVLICIL